MGRIKEVFIQMQAEDYQGDPDAYMKKYVEELKNAEEKEQIACPNCFKHSLISTEKENILECQDCGYDFIRIDNTTLRFR
tara:strand:- start:8337 stop:8576 length:240 start_codon:yes stop_codon:yes gene_type:complete